MKFAAGLATGLTIGFAAIVLIAAIGAAAHHDRRYD